MKEWSVNGVQNTLDIKKSNLDRLMREHGDGVFRLCYMYLNEYQLAEDALQDTFLRVYTKYDGFRHESSEKTWITRIAINVCKSFMRKKSFSEKPVDESEFAQYETLEDASLEDIVFERERNSRLFKAVIKLDRIYKEVILLFYYRELKTNEIASILKIPEGTVKTRLMRARTILENEVKEELL